MGPVTLHGGLLSSSLLGISFGSSSTSSHSLDSYYPSSPLTSCSGKNCLHFRSFHGLGVETIWSQVNFFSPVGHADILSHRSYVVITNPSKTLKATRRSPPQKVNISTHQVDCDCPVRHPRVLWCTSSYFSAKVFQFIPERITITVPL